MPLVARLAATALLGVSLHASTPELDGPASADATAVRDVQFSPTAQCDLATFDALSRAHPGVRQIVLVAAATPTSTTARLEVAVRSTTGAWRCQVGPRVATVGRSGVRPLAERRSGDGTTPAGVFPLGQVTAWDGQLFSMFGNRPDPGVQVPYRAVRQQDCWGATPGTARYQHLVNLPGCPGPDDEWLPRFGDVYSHAAVIGANLDPISGDAPGEPPLAAAIFLHRHSYASSRAVRPTSGCVSLASADLVEVLTLLDADLQPHFAIGTAADLRAG